MFYNQSDNCIPFVHIFDIITLFTAEMEKLKIGISGKWITHRIDGKVVLYTSLVRCTSCNDFTASPAFHMSSTSLLETLQEKEKLLVMSNFSFSHTVFNQSDELYATIMKFKIVICKLFQFQRL